MEIKIEVSEGDIPFIKEGMRLRYTLLSDPDTTYKAKISSIDPGDTVLSNATGNSVSSASSSASSASAVYYYAKARVPNPDGILRLAMTTQNVIEIDFAKDVLLLPSLVIQSDGRGGHTVNVLTADNKVEKRKVETGINNNVMTEIRSGLKEGALLLLLINFISTSGWLISRRINSPAV